MTDFHFCWMVQLQPATWFQCDVQSTLFIVASCIGFILNPGFVGFL